MLPDNVAKNPCRAVLFVASSESNDYLRKATACLIKTESLTAKKKTQTKQTRQLIKILFLRSRCEENVVSG